VAAVTGTELRYLGRATPGKLGLVLMPVLTVVLSATLARDVDRAVLGLEPERLLFFGLAVYIVLFSTNFVTNAFAWDGNAVREYFLRPVTPRAVLVGKNLGVWLYGAVLLVEALCGWAVVRGLPRPLTLLGAALAYALSLVAVTTVGNFTSVLFPVGRSPGALGNSPSQVALLATFAVLAVDAVAVGAVLVVAARLGAPWLEVAALAALLAAVSLAYWLLLGPAARLLERRREALVAALESSG
jgi:ABC-2 type transport system permease protein